MADTKISGMAAAAALTGAEVLPVVQSAANVKATTQQVVDAAMTTGLTRQALGSINTNTTIDWSAGSYATATIAGALAFTFSDPAPTGKACVAYLQLTNGGSAAITWPISVTWSGGTAPTLRASGVDLLRFYTQDNGTTWFGTAENDESNVAGSDTQVLFNDGGTASGDSGLTYNKTTDTLTCKVYQAQRANNAPIIQTGTTSSDACIIWVTGNELQAARGDIGDLISFRASIVKASAQFQSGSYAMGVYNSGLAFGNTNFSAFANATCHSVFVCGATGGYDTALTRDAAGTLAQRDGTNAQTFRVYHSYTDASNYSRWTVKWNTSTAILHAEGAGTGSDGSVAFNDAALATDATRGFLMIPSCAGTPTGTPADIPTGQAPIVYDSTNKKLCVWDGAAWVQTPALT